MIKIFFAPLASVRIILSAASPQNR